MRRVVLLLVVLAALLLSASALPHHKRLRKVAAHAEEVEEQQPALVEQEQEQEVSTEIVSSLKHLLEEKKKSGLAARAKLEAAAEHTLAVEAALAEKSAQLKSHNAMLARLEQCLAQGPAEQRFKQLEHANKLAEQSLLEAQSSVEEKDQQLQEQQEELDAKAEELENKEQELASKNEEFLASQKHLAEQQSLLEKQALEVSQKEASLQSLIETSVAKKVAERIEAVRAEATAAKDAQIAALKQQMAEKTANLLKEQEVALMERRAAKIASRHQWADLTTIDGTPYAQASDAAEIESDGAEPSLIEMSAQMMVHAGPDKPAAAAPAVPAGPTTSSNSSASPFAAKLTAHCSAYTSCSACGGDGRCAWCSANGGSCLPLDVNANLRGGAGSDGLTSGQCTSDNWLTAVASRLTLLSLNVFASERGNSTRRFASIVQLIKKTSADVIALQEVEKWFVHALQAHSWIKNNYHATEYGPGQAPGGLYILSRYPIASTNYYENIQPGQIEVSKRGRVLVAKLGVKQQAVYVATTNLDYRSAENRASSLEFIFRTLKPYRHTFLLGDFNFDEGSKVETAAIPRSYLDLWPTLITDRPGYTWNPRSNWFAAASDPRSRASRIDRVYLRSNQWMPRSIHLVGCSVSDPLCGAKNLDVKKGVTLIDANKVNPALILAAPTNAADLKSPVEQEWGTKVLLELESSVEHLQGEEEHQQVLAALFEEEAQTAFVEMGVDLHAAIGAPRPTFEPDFVPSNHYGLLVQATQFAPKCPSTEEL